MTDKQPAPPSAIDQAIQGLGGPAETPAKAPGQAWASPEPAIERVVRASLMEGALLKIDVIPTDIDTYVEIRNLPTKGQRRGAFVIGFWDLPGLQKIVAQRQMRLELDDGAQELLDRWNRWCLELEWLKNFADYPDFSLSGVEIKFLKFQARGIHYLAKIKRALCGDQPGLGKSIQIIGTTTKLRRDTGKALKTMILSPASVVGDWAKKFKRFANIDLAVADGSKSERRAVYERAGEWLVVSYDLFLRDYVEIAANFVADIVVADECQRLINRKSMATQRLFEYVDLIRPEYRYFLSGSPIANAPGDLWPILRMIHPQLAGSAKAYDKRYLKLAPIWKRYKETGKPKVLQIEYGSGEKVRKFTPMKVTGFQNLDELRLKIAPYLIRRLKTDVKDELGTLGDKIYEEIEITLGPRERRAYEELQVEFAEAMAGVSDNDLEGSTRTFLQWFIRAQQICASLEINDLGKESSKIDELRDFVRDRAQDNKIIIFSRFKAMTDIVVREFRDYSPLYLNGDVPQKDRQPLVDAFQEKDEHRLFIATLQAGGVGLTLTAAPLVVRLDRWLAPHLNEQAVDRAHRIGQDKTVIVTDFRVKDSVEDRIEEILGKKKRLIGAIMSDEEIVKKLHRKDMLRLI